ncbi:ABC transporter [Fibrobacterales bacterium]|nr:ABC transporter [Fibrobacterales bacterium]
MKNIIPHDRSSDNAQRSARPTSRRWRIIREFILSLFAVVSKNFLLTKSAYGKFFRDFFREWSLFFHDRNAVLLLVVAVIFYALYYPLPYINGVAKHIPVAVVDSDNSVMSRQLIQFLKASGDLDITQVADKNEAQKKLAGEEVYGFVEIPFEFEHDIRRGQHISLGVFCNGGYFMVYSDISRAVLYAAGTLGAGVQIAFMQARGVSPNAALSLREPVLVGTQTLFNGAMRYDNYVVPAVLVVIMQQTMVIGICILGGARRKRSFGATSITSDAGLLRRWFGRGTVYILHYFLILLFYLFVIYPFFGWNGRGKFVDIAIFAVVFFTACNQMGFFFAQFFKKKESAMQVFLYMSIPFLFVSGFSYPTSSIPQFLHYLFFLIPAEHAIPAFVSIQQAGANIWEVGDEIVYLATIAVIYCVAGLGLQWWRERV